MSLTYCICPYCEEETEIELDEQKQSETYTENCEKCKKKYEYYYETSVDVYPNIILDVKK